ncbi:uncharacterized protein [Dendropsophus ebraccatus]|uniref:uncharacterized protein n=1 Tax=Dendropsophus ebraccatus TaxID=150705 RepID=UPI0038320384
MTELKDKVRETNPSQDFTQAFSTMDNAISFMAEASADALKLTARSAALSNSARCTLWLKDWKGDTTSKAKLCGIPCEGKFLFGSALDNVLEKASDRKKGFPIIPQQSSRPARGRDCKIPVLVGTTRKSVQRTPLEHPGGGTDHNRRQPIRLGGSFGVPTPSGKMECGRGKTVPKCKRTGRRFSIFDASPSRTTGKKCKSSVRQCSSRSLHQPSRRNKISRPDENNSLHLQVSRTPLPLLDSLTSERSRQHNSRLSQSTQTQSGGMGTIPGGVPANLQTLGNSEDGLIRYTGQQESSEILLPPPEGQTCSGGCPGTVLGGGPVISLSSDQTSPQSHSQDQT